MSIRMTTRRFFIVFITALFASSIVAITPVHADEEGVNIYRLWNRVSGEHLLTSSENEVTVLATGNYWVYEGIAWVAPTKGLPIHRLYNPDTSDHHYTGDAHEILVLTTQYRWIDEGITSYSASEKGIPIYRQFNPKNSVGAHNYTSSLHEYNTNNSRDWIGEGTAWYALRDGQNATAFMTSTTRPNMPFTLDTMASFQLTNPYYKNRYSQQQLKDILDPKRVNLFTPEYFQFADISHTTHLTAENINAFISSTSSGRSGTLAGLGYLFIQAAQTYNINEAYLVAHAVLESGWGTSELARGYYYDGTKPVDGKLYPAGTYYNYFGIGAVDSGPLSGGRAMAIKSGWNSRTAAIMGGAQWISYHYIHGAGAHTYDQPTLYAMKWDYPRSAATGARGWHQYATDVEWPAKIARLMKTAYSTSPTPPRLTYIIPAYR